MAGASATLRRLEPDQRLQGRVLAVQGSQIVIALLGERITAESRLSLQIGQLLDLVVREVRPDRVTLQIAQETEGTMPILQPLTDQGLRDLLVAQHVQADPTNLLIARALIRNALPITSTIVLTARHALLFIDAPPAADVDAAIFLMAKDLPVTPQSLDLAKDALLQPDSLGARVQTLATQLVELLSQPTPEGATPVLPRPLLALAQRVLQDLPLVLPDQARGQALAALIRQVLDQIGTPTEARLARLLEEPRTVSSCPNQPAGPARAQPSAAGAARAVLIESPPRASEGQPDIAQGEGHQALPVLPRLQSQEMAHDFRQQLVLLKDTLALVASEFPRDHSGAPPLHQLQTTIREVISMVEREQLANAGLPPPTQAQGYYLFHLPIATVGQDATDTAEVRIYYQQRDRTKQVDPENAHLAFLLTMSRLGPVAVHVDLYQKHLRCRIECVRQDATDLFQQSSHELKERLKDIGYVVDAIHSATARSPEMRSEPPATSNLFTIDVQA